MRTKENKKGISLIVLIVTIIVVIILAAVVILTLSKNNPIESAKEARFKDDVRTFQDELALAISKEYADAGGHRDGKISTSDFDEIKRYIPSFTKKYDGVFVIKNDELVQIDENELKISNFLNTNLSNEIKYLIQNGVEIEPNYTEIGVNSKVFDNNYLQTSFKNYIQSSRYDVSYDASKAFDNNEETYWCTEGLKQSGAYVGVEFEEPVDIWCVKLFNQYNNKSNEVKLQCSNDNITWLDASDVVNPQNLIINSKQKDEFKYWRIYNISSQYSFATASEIKFYGGKKESYPVVENISDSLVKFLIGTNSKLEIDDVITYNFLDKISSIDTKLKIYLLNIEFVEKFKEKKMGLLSKITNTDNVICSSIYDSNYDSYKAFDKNNNSYWCTAAWKANNSYLGYIFDRDTYIKYVEVLSNDYRPKEVKLQCSNDNNVWIDASDIITLENTNKTQCIESNIKDKAYKYWRLYVLSSYREYTGIYEMNFYGLK